MPIEYELTQSAIDELIRLSREVGSPIADRSEFQVLWDERLVMGDKQRCHITSRGKNLLRRQGLI